MRCLTYHETCVLLAARHDFPLLLLVVSHRFSKRIPDAQVLIGGAGWLDTPHDMAARSFNGRCASIGAVFSRPVVWEWPD